MEKDDLTGIVTEALCDGRYKIVEFRDGYNSPYYRIKIQQWGPFYMWYEKYYDSKWEGASYNEAFEKVKELHDKYLKAIRKEVNQ